RLWCWNDIFMTSYRCVVLGRFFAMLNLAEQPHRRSDLCRSFHYRSCYNPAASNPHTNQTEIKQQGLLAKVSIFCISSFRHSAIIVLTTMVVLLTTEPVYCAK
ncbi:MAG: hypothetical protein NTY53_22195, partial [Kiritimatiellaeota bacterium]|nr:hypothetical protein [Kiritimatiellota bacterium]